MRRFLRIIVAPFARVLDAAAAPIRRRLSSVFAPLAAQASARYRKLESRERLLVKIGVAVFGLFIAYDFVYLPIDQMQDDLHARIETRQRDLKEVHRLVDIYLQREAELKVAEQRTVPNARDFSLFSVVEATLTRSVGRDKIGSITPGADRKLSDGFTQHSVQLKLQNVNLAQIVDALYGVRSLNVPISVAALRITRRSQDLHSFDVDMTCVALAKNG